MSLYKSSQVIEVEDTSEIVPLEGDEIIVYEEKPSPQEVIENTPNSLEVSFKLPFIPGAPEADVIEVSSNDEEKSKSDENKSDDKPTDIWDWQSGGLSNFMDWLKSILNSIPKHSGKDTSGIERVIFYLKKADSEISKAMQSDLNGELDASQIEEFRRQIYDGIERLENRLDELFGHLKKTKKKKSEMNNDLVKEGQKATHVGGIIITVPLLISRLARICINGSVSAGKDIEDIFDKLVKKYKLTHREQAELMQLLSDMNFPIRRDRGYNIDEEYETTSTENNEFIANYPS